MKVKFLGATPEEDRVIEIPEGTKTVEVTSDHVCTCSESPRTPWPAAAVMIAMMITIIVVTWLITRG